VAGRFVRLSVSDTGTGMDAQTRERAFEPFFTTKQARGSAGLGLATVDGVVRRAGGHIRMYSEPGIGTTVNVFLPAVEEPVPAVAAVPRADGTPRRGRILVVEDQPELAELIRYLLEPAGYTVTVTTDPAAAIAQIHTGAHPDLLLTDVVMPGMTGSELAKALRVRRPGLRVLYMSGYTAGVLNPQGHLDTGSALLQKPFNRESLLAAIDRALTPTGRAR
jgi:CheY-like chemotaxis protein